MQGGVLLWIVVIIILLKNVDVDALKDPIIEAKIKSLLAVMTIKEKAAQMCIYTPPVKDGYYSSTMAMEVCLSHLVLSFMIIYLRT
jgi:hypothetical protein